MVYYLPFIRSWRSWLLAFCYRSDGQRTALGVTWQRRRRHNTPPPPPRRRRPSPAAGFNGAKTNPFSLGRWATPSLPPSPSPSLFARPPSTVHSIWQTVTRVRASPGETIVHGGMPLLLPPTGMALQSDNGTGSLTVFGIWTRLERGKGRKKPAVYGLNRTTQSTALFTPRSSWSVRFLTPDISVKKDIRYLSQEAGTNHDPLISGSAVHT